MHYKYNSSTRILDRVMFTSGQLSTFKLFRDSQLPNSGKDYWSFIQFDGIGFPTATTNGVNNTSKNFRIGDIYHGVNLKHYDCKNDIKRIVPQHYTGYVMIMDILVTKCSKPRCDMVVYFLDGSFTAK